MTCPSGDQKLFCWFLQTEGLDGSESSMIDHKNNKMFRYETVESDIL